MKSKERKVDEAEIKEDEQQKAEKEWKFLEFVNVMNKKSEKVKTQTWNESFAAFGEEETNKNKSRWGKAKAQKEE